MSHGHKLPSWDVHFEYSMFPAHYVYAGPLKSKTEEREKQNKWQSPVKKRESVYRPQKVDAASEL